MPESFWAEHILVTAAARTSALISTAAMHTPLPIRVIRVISSERNRLPLFTQVQTFRRVALSDVTGQYRKWTKDHAYP